MKQEPQPIIRNDGTELRAYLIKSHCKVGTQVKELWKVDSILFESVCHMCCFKHRRCGCTYLAFGRERPCVYYNKKFGYTHFFQELQKPEQAQQPKQPSFHHHCIAQICTFFHRRWPIEKAGQ